MASMMQQLSSKVTAFFYDHQTVPSKGKKLRHSYKEVEKFIYSMGESRDKNKK